MGNIPILQTRAIPVQTMTESVQSAAQAGRMLSDVAGMGVNIVLEKQHRIKQADDFSAVNEYGLRAEAELNDEMEAFQKSNANDPKEKYKTFDMAVKKKLDAYREQLPSEEAKMMFDKYGAQLRGNYQSKMQNWEDVTRTYNFAKRAENAAELNNKKAFMDGDLNNLPKYLGQAKANSVIATMISGDNKAPEIGKVNARGAVKALLMGAAEKDPTAARAALKEEKFNKWLDADDLIALDNSFEAAERKRAAEMQDQKNQEAQSSLNDLRVKAYKGEDISQDAEGLYKQGTLNGTQYVTIMRDMEKYQKESLNRSAGREKMALVQQGQATLNPTDAKDMKALDDYYTTTFLPTIAGQDADVAARSTVDFIRDFGSVPPSLKSNIEASLLAGNPEQQSQNASLVANIVQTNPRAAVQFDDKTMSYAMRLNDLTNAGVPLTQAIKSAQDGTFKAGTPEYAGRAQDYANQKKGTNPAIAFNAGAFTQFFTNDPAEVPSEMKRQWDALARHYYVDQGLNAESAQTAANAALQKTWAITKIGKGGEPRWMQYAPESYYGEGDWLQKQLMKDLGTMGVLKNKPVGNLAKDARERGRFNKEAEEFLKTSYLVPVPNNLNAAGKPQYYIYREQDGVQNIVLGTNPKTGKTEALIFAPDYNATKEGKRINDNLAKATAKAEEKAKKAYENFQMQRKTSFTQDEFDAIQERQGYSPLDEQLTDRKRTGA